MMEKSRPLSATLRGSPSSVTSCAKLSAPHCLERKLYLLTLKPHIWLRMVVSILGAVLGLAEEPNRNFGRGLTEAPY
jgi:hypothetical protein